MKTKEPSGLALQFSKENVPIDELFAVSDEVQIHADMPYGQLAEKLAVKDCRCQRQWAIKLKPVCKLTVLSNSPSSDSFAVIFP